jgi:hypothetical protein
MTDLTNPPIPFGAPKPRRNIAIEESHEMTRQLEQQMAKPEPTYTSVVAEGIDACRYLDVKAIATAIMGEPVKPIETVSDLADRMAEWGAANKTGAKRD